MIYYIIYYLNYCLFNAAAVGFDHEITASLTKDITIPAEKLQSIYTYIIIACQIVTKMP